MAVIVIEDQMFYYNTSGSSEVINYEYLNIFFVILFEGLRVIKNNNFTALFQALFQSVEYTTHFMEILKLIRIIM